MPQMTIERLLEEKIGLSAEAIGSRVIEKAVHKRMTVYDLTDVGAYLRQLQVSELEWNELVETVVIPETWFFRNHQSFTFLEEYIKTVWLSQHQAEEIRVLSIPCSTGEEPYSIAITLLEAGVRPESVHLDAIDISEHALQKARQGIYGEESFRNKETLLLRERYFERKQKMYQIHPSIKPMVRFARGNLLDRDDREILANEKPYHLIFCRNLLIYLSNEAKKYAAAILSRLLSKTGILFVGHAERSVFEDTEFEWVRQPGVFACRRISAPQPPTKQALPPIPYLFERRKTNRLSEQPDKAVSSPSGTGNPAGKEPKIPEPSVERRKTIAKLLDKARQLADQGQLNEAFVLCEQSLRDNPTDVQANFLTGLIWLASGDEKQAETFFTKTVYLDPKHHEALNYLAFIAEYRGQHEKALLLRQRIERIHRQLQTVV